MKTWITTKVYNHCEQKLLIQPTPSLDGAKWQQERSYSEEDIKLAFEEGFNVCRCVTDNIVETKECFNEWYNRFKKK